MIDSEARARDAPVAKNVEPRVGRRAWINGRDSSCSGFDTRQPSVMAAGMTGCVTFCDECDDFPIPGGYAAMPGTYTGPPVTHGGESRPSTDALGDGGAVTRAERSLSRRPPKKRPRRRTP